MNVSISHSVKRMIGPENISDRRPAKWSPCHPLRSLSAIHSPGKEERTGEKPARSRRLITQIQMDPA